MKTDIFKVVWLPSVMHTYHRVRLCGVHPSVESSFAVCITLRSNVSQISQKTLMCASYRGVCNMHHTTESNSTVWCTPQSQYRKFWWSLLASKGKIRRPLLGVNISIMKENILIIKSGFTKPKIFTLRCHAHHGVKHIKLCDRIS